MGKSGATTAASVLVDAVKAAPAGYSWMDRVRAIPAMVRGTLAGEDTGASRPGVVLSLLGLLYVVSPVDFLPELLLGPLGVGDDLAMAGVAVAYLVSSADRYLEHRSNPASASAEVVEGVVIARSDDSGPVS